MQFQDDLAGGIFLIRPALRSPDYVTGVSGWTINQDGSAEFNDVTVRGDLESSNYVAGVSGWRLDDSGSAEFNDVLIRGTATGDVLVVGPTGLPQVSIGSLPSTGYVRWTSNRAIESRPSEIVGGFGNPGAANEFAALAIAGPAVSGAGDHIRLHLRSQPDDGSDPAMIQAYNYDGVTLEEIFQLTRASMFVVGPRTILQPATLTDTALFVNLLVGHTGRSFRVQNNGADVFVVDANGTITDYASWTSFTPTWNNIGTATFSTNVGWYKRIDDMWLFEIYAVASAGGSGTTAITISNLPFNPFRAGNGAASTREIVSAHCGGVAAGTNASVSGSFTALCLAGGAANTIDRLTGPTSLDMRGENIGASTVITIKGWMRST